MTYPNKYRVFPAFLFLMLGFGQVHAQKIKEIEALAQLPKPEKNFPLNYKIALPAADFDSWNQDYEQYRKFITPAMQKTQLGLAATDDGVKHWMISNSVIPHAQLDTSTMIKSQSDLYGTWRMVTQRKIRFTDSAVYGDDRKLYRSEALLDDVTHSEDNFLRIDSDRMKLHFKKKDKSRFKSLGSTRYSLENGRSLLLYGFLKSAAVVAQVGLDEDQNLILILPAVTETVKPGTYGVYNAILEQMIFVKVAAQ